MTATAYAAAFFAEMGMAGKGPLKGALGPKMQAPPKPPLMQSQADVTQAQQIEASKAAAMREGRASTILTTNADTGDKLGP